jgi:uncharacterized protein YegP (UPF0339 family)
MAKSKTGRIEICDSKKRKGEYFVRIVAGNNEKLATGETVKTRQAVNKQIMAICRAVDAIEYSKFNIAMLHNTIDRTRSGYWSKRYGITHKPITEKK